MEIKNFEVKKLVTNHYKKSLITFLALGCGGFFFNFFLGEMGQFVQ